jgi:hypothetical protein
MCYYDCVDANINYVDFVQSDWPRKKVNSSHILGQTHSQKYFATFVTTVLNNVEYQITFL